MTIIRDQWKPYAISSQDAQIAKELGLRADSLEEDEKQLFPFLLQTTTANKYLSGRNFLIKEWHLNYSNSIMSFSAVADLKLTVISIYSPLCNKHIDYFGCISFAKSISILGSI